MGWIGRLSMAAAAWGIACSCALAQSPAGPTAASAPSAAQSAPAQQATAPTVPTPSPGSCVKAIAGARLGAPSAYVAQLDPDTLWRPRGAEVQFTLGGTAGAPPQVKRVLVCFRWELAHADQATAPDYTPSTLVRSVPNTAGMIEYGALVPELPAASHFGSGPDGVGAVAYTAVYTVPIADMQVLVELADGTWFAVVLPVGVTNVPTALIILGVSLLFAGVILWRWGPMQLFPGVPPSRFGVASRHVLAIISTSNGVASLSQFQIMLWTLVVAGSAVYVMSLSGNLIAISSGTLTLLGIAGGTSVLARVPVKGTAATDAGAAAPPGPAPAPAPAPAAAQSIPHWFQILVDDAAHPEIDVTRVQMLMFTLITAVFVAIKVAVTYSIPEIPDNFLVLMGISNGVYLAGKHIPSTPKGTAA